MTTPDQTTGSVTATIGGFVDRMRQRQARARTRRAIAGLDDATLRDIGLSRAEAFSIAYCGQDRRRPHG